MTRKDYVIIATALAQAKAEATSASVRMGVDSCIEHITHALQVSEPRFQASKFKTFINKTAKEI